MWMRWFLSRRKIDTCFELLLALSLHLQKQVSHNAVVLLIKLFTVFPSLSILFFFLSRLENTGIFLSFQKYNNLTCSVFLALPQRFQFSLITYIHLCNVMRL